MKCSFLAKSNSTGINKSPSSTETCTIMTRRLLNGRENTQNGVNRQLDGDCRTFPQTRSLVINTQRLML